MPRTCSSKSKRDWFRGGGRLLTGPDGTFQQFPAGQFQNQLTAATAGPVELLSIGAPFEPEGRITVQIQFASRTANRLHGKVRHFDEYAGRAVADFRSCSAHDAADRHWFFCIGNDAHVGLQFVFLVIDGFDFLAVLREPNNDAVPGQLVEVERVQRLSALHQHIISDVDDVVNRCDADCCQPIPHPPGTRTNFDAFDHTSDVPGAYILALDRHRSHIANRPAAFSW
jgi:hypothetical protein